MRQALNALTIFLGLAAIYCFCCVLQAGSFAFSPGYSQIRAEHNEYFWTGLSGVFLSVSLILILVRKRFRRVCKNKSTSNQGCT